MLIAAARLFDGQADSIHAGPADERRGGPDRERTHAAARIARRQPQMLDLGDVTLLPGQIDNNIWRSTPQTIRGRIWQMSTRPPCCCECAPRRCGRSRAGSPRFATLATRTCLLDAA